MMHTNFPYFRFLPPAYAIEVMFSSCVCVCVCVCVVCVSTGNPQKLALGLFVGKGLFQNKKLTTFYKAMVFSVATWSNFWGRPYLFIIVQLKF